MLLQHHIYGRNTQIGNRATGFSAELLKTMAISNNEISLNYVVDYVQIVGVLTGALIVLPAQHVGTSLYYWTR